MSNRKPNSIGRPAKFNRDDILSAAIEVLNSAGHDSLSMRSIAKSLGTGPASLYGHFDSLSDLEDALAESLLLTLPTPSETNPEKLKAELILASVEYFKLILRQPKLAAMMGPASRRVSAKMVNNILFLLTEIGVEIERAGLSYAILRGLAQEHANTVSQLSTNPTGSSTVGLIELNEKEFKYFLEYRMSPIFGKSPIDTLKNALQKTIERMLPELNIKESN